MNYNNESPINLFPKKIYLLLALKKEEFADEIQKTESLAKDFHPSKSFLENTVFTI